MSIVKKIVEALDGDIEIHSKEGTGTSVTLTFSFRVSGVKKDIEEIREQEHERITDRRIVLIAEDQQENREVLVDYLNDLGIQSEYAMNGETGCRHVHRVRGRNIQGGLHGYRDACAGRGDRALLNIRGLNRRDKNIPIIALDSQCIPVRQRESAESGNGSLSDEATENGGVIRTPPQGGRHPSSLMFRSLRGE
ncbi:MAG: hypothetical protein V8Q42_13195 [Anaerovoracaceae bacterium]